MSAVNLRAAVLSDFRNAEGTQTYSVGLDAIFDDRSLTFSDEISIHTTRDQAQFIADHLNEFFKKVGDAQS